MRKLIYIVNLTFRKLVLGLFISLTSCNITTDELSLDQKKINKKYPGNYKGYKSRNVTLPKPGIYFDPYEGIETFSFQPKDSLGAIQYTYPHQDSVYNTLSFNQYGYAGTVYKKYENWVVRKDQSIDHVKYNDKDSTCIVYKSPKGNFFLKREDIKITKRYYERKLIKILKIKDSLGEYVVNNPSGSRFYWYPHKDSIFPEYHKRYNQQSKKSLPLYESRFVYQPTLYKDWLVFKNSFQIKSYDSLHEYEVNFKTDYGYVFTPKKDYIIKSDIRIKESLLTEALGDNYKPIRIDSLLEITLTNKNEFNKYKKVNYGIVYDSKIKRQGKSITLPIKNSPNKVVYKDSQGEYYTKYEYKGEIPFLDIYIIEFNDPEYLVDLLVSKTTGKELITLNGPLNMSPNLDIIVSINLDFYNESSSIQISKIKKGKLEILYSTAFSNWLVDYNPEVKWVNNSTFIVKAVSPVQNKAFSNKEEEKIEYLKIKIKDQLLNKK